MVTVWKREAEKAEVQELGYLSVLQQREPTHTFRHDLNTFKAQGTQHAQPMSQPVTLTLNRALTHDLWKILRATSGTGCGHNVAVCSLQERP